MLVTSYPLFVFATASTPDTLSHLVTEQDEEYEVDETEPLYDLSQLCDETYLDAQYWNRIEQLLRDKRQIILYGPPGTGKTFVAQKLAQYWVDSAQEPGGEYQVIQFHPSYAYEEFMEGIRPRSIDSPNGGKMIDYPVRAGVFKEFCNQAREKKGRRYVLVIDEINRGDMPRIFGELMYLLEYRGEQITLPYSGSEFNIPGNVFIIGTMNTADRSIALVDHALRRRFHFVKAVPDGTILADWFMANNNEEMGWVADLLKLLNEHLQQDGIDWHLQIGHSHFMKENLDDSDLEMIWEYTILSTLEEYFYRDPKKLSRYQLAALKAELGR